MGWTMTQTSEKLRGAGRFAQPIARIRREARTWPEVEIRMQELRPSPMGPDGRPIRLEIGNVEDFIHAFEQFMHGQRMLRDEWARALPLWTRKADRPLARQIRDMARDWESCRAHLMEVRRPEPPQPRVERRLRSKRKRDPEPRETMPSRGGRNALARREELILEAEEQGAYPELGVPQASEGHDERSRDMPREEVLEPEQETRQRAERGVVEEVIEVGEDTPPQTHAAELGPEITPEIAREEGARQEEVPSSPPEVILSPGVRVEMEREKTNWRRETTSTIDRYLAAHALEHPDIEEPVPREPPQEPRQAEGEIGAEIPGRADHRTRGRVPAGETAEEKRARVGKRLEEIWQERQRLEEAGALPDQPPPPKPCGIKEMWDEFLDQHGKGLATLKSAEVGTYRKADEYLDRKIRFLTKTSFNRYLMLEADLAGKKMKEASLGARLEAAEAEVRELRELVASQAAIIQDLRQRPRNGDERTERKEPAKVVDGAWSSRHDP
ncbi:hypothetical protein CBR_g54838 [Chara braunii]|uniref:Uncharacterized protein n=1 Tax=Chara braunii TaxID=69332 RepID=A0A388JPL9_CHABU|nr:hypothetical protein CBR_g54838 [Chara braunii]|eukprot:GBG59735.1 hypothetical protein CBR_g54838 [Chara braunii]